mgnify:CR=1 FL=1
MFTGSTTGFPRQKAHAAGWQCDGTIGGRQTDIEAQSLQFFPEVIRVDQAQPVCLIVTLVETILFDKAVDQSSQSSARGIDGRFNQY